jgi:hypothetical protein
MLAAQAAAHASSRCACAAEARTRNSPSGSSPTPIATAVCEPLCGSIPIITAAMPSPPRDARCDRGGHALLQGRIGVRASFEPHHGKGTDELARR